MRLPFSRCISNVESSRFVTHDGGTRSHRVRYSVALIISKVGASINTLARDFDNDTCNALATDR